MTDKHVLPFPLRDCVYNSNRIDGEVCEIIFSSRGFHSNTQIPISNKQKFPTMKYFGAIEALCRSMLLF